MSKDYLRVRFIRDYNRDGNAIGLAHYSEKLRKEYDHPGIVIEDQRVMSSNRQYLTGKVSFKPRKTETPLEVMVRERLALAKRTILSDHASGDFVILELVIAGESYDPEELLFGYREKPGTTREMIEAVLDGHPNCELVAGWLKKVVAGEGLTSRGLITKMNSALNKGDYLFQKEDREFEEHLEAYLPGLMAWVHREHPGVEARHVWNHLVTSSGVLEAVSAPRTIGTAFFLEDFIAELYRQHNAGTAASITDEVLSQAMARFDAHSEKGQMLRFGMFLAAQLGMETIEKRRGVSSLSVLHERLMVTREDTAYHVTGYP